jgi:hypothetical protein
LLIYGELKLTVETLVSEVEYRSGGPDFPISFRFLHDSDIQAVLVRNNGSSEILSPSQYTITGAGAQNGGILTSSYAASALSLPGSVLTIVRVMVPIQQTDLRNQGRFLAETHEVVFDRLTMLIQQGLSLFSRALIRPFGKNYYDANGYRISNLADPNSPQDAATKSSTDNAVSIEANERQAADAYLQMQISGGAPVQASAFSEISWHNQVIQNSVIIPPGKNAWSFGPVMTVAPGQSVTVSEGSFYTIANGELHQ